MKTLNIVGCLLGVGLTTIAVAQPISKPSMKIHSPTIAEILRDDKWQVAQVSKAEGPALLRYRIPILGPDDVEGYDKVLRVLWAYAAEGSGALPTAQDAKAMEQFERRLADSLEIDTHGFLAAVLTFDGARQWVFYTKDIAECGRRINEMPQERKPYPIEIDAFDDPHREYLRTTLLAKFK